MARDLPSGFGIRAYIANGGDDHCLIRPYLGDARQIDVASLDELIADARAELAIAAAWVSELEKARDGMAVVIDEGSV
jgi:hypothetical protein